MLAFVKCCIWLLACWHAAESAYVCVLHVYIVMYIRPHSKSEVLLLHIHNSQLHTCMYLRTFQPVVSTTGFLPLVSFHKLGMSPQLSIIALCLFRNFSGLSCYNNNIGGGWTSVFGNPDAKLIVTYVSHWHKAGVKTRAFIVWLNFPVSVALHHFMALS
jgi:hypothetical protein